MWVAVHALALLPLPSRLPNQPAVWPCSAAKPAARCRILCCDAEDPWLLLGVSYSATDAQIRRAFRHQARELHPDVCTDPEAPERFRSLVEAFKKLRTDESRARWRTQSRAAYDRRVRGSAKERAARAWGAPDRPRGSTSRPRTAARSATGVRKTAAERAAQSWREVEERAQAQAQTATTPPSPPRSPPPPPPPPPPKSQQQSAGSWPHQQSSEPPAQATPAGPLLCEVLLVELRDVRDRTRHHAERAAWRRGGLRAQLARADLRGTHWRLKQEAQPAGSAERVAAMRGELQLLELAARLRERLADQNEALELLEVEERALTRRLREALENRRAS